MGIVVAMATKIRLDMIKSGILKSNILSELTDNTSERLSRIKIEFRLSKLIQEFGDTNQNFSVIAAMVWLHSVRVLTIPGIRHLGTAMWAELQRGFPFAMNAVETIRLSESTPLPPDINSELEFIPPMLEIIRDS